ncbi:outer membrane protein transport protein [Rhodohalobacter mucosus]|uniref:Outer membrane protein transport protein (OMPP1/FadL/TodX) n=1 Tax=Rhodohalobacter mucosus TaxID=2079485 RepID=A0A316TQH4_9BACT|nr:outer membrane protein transport protein [Rhodohalobacter mucosus]PWN06857.1 hypothetical protein DDZ15_06165 [Rhodohalobacter mucosus]
MSENSIKITILSVSLILTAGVGTSLAQVTGANPNNRLLYSNQATLFGDYGQPLDPVSLILPGTAFGAGFGSYQDNPASAAFFRESFGEAGFSLRSVEEESIYRGNSRLADDQQTTLSNLGVVYVFPTTRGSLVAGAGYTQHSSFNRALSLRARNNVSSITDNFKTPGSSYADIAFNTFATDYGDEFQDWDESIFRIGFDQPGDFLGIDQNAEIFESGYGGEFSAFLGTEIRKNLMIGFSLGLLNGNYTYTRAFQEIDGFNDYSSDFLDVDGDGTGETDIDRILLDDRIEVDYSGIRLRLGAIYKINKHLNAGASYAFGTRIQVDELFSANIATTFDNGEMFEDDIDSEFRYFFTFPARTSLGLAVTDYKGLTISASAEYVDYSGTEIDFVQSRLLEDQQIENEFISETFSPVWNVRVGAAYDLSPFATLRGGFAVYPDKFETSDNDRGVLLFGAGFTLTDNVRLELAAQYTNWEETSAVYDYAEYDYSDLPDSSPSFTIGSENANRNADRWNMLATIKFGL